MLYRTESKQRVRWYLAAVIAWSMVFLGLVIRMTLAGHRPTTLGLYELAGQHWIHGEPLYQHVRGFVYSPAVAVFFALFACLPAVSRPVVWIAVNAGVFLAGIAAVLRAGIYPRLGPQSRGIVFLLLIPLALGNLDVAQINPLMAGLLMLAVAAARTGRWGVAAVCVALATGLKIYPLVVGLLLGLVAPRQFGCRLLLALLVLGLLPFLFQHADYVQEQYHSWFVTRLADNRLENSDRHVPLDLWLLLVRIAGLGIKPWFYKCIQVCGGGAVALCCVAGVRRGWPQERLLAGLFSLSCVWMTLCGPATEGFTYVILAPAVVIAFVQALAERRPIWLRALVTGAYALLLLAVVKNSLMPHLALWTGGAQPVAALLFLAYCLFWILDDSQWPASSPWTSGGSTPGAPRRSGSAFQPTTTERSRLKT